MKWAAIVRKYFDERLSRLGFRPMEGVLCVWVKPTGEFSELMVEVEKERGFHSLHVCLRRRGREEVVFDLAEAAGVRRYEYRDAKELESVVELARRHFEQWGVDWLEGRPVTSPALTARADLHRQHTHERLIREGRAAFKAKKLEEAIARFSEAAGLRPLDDISDKMLGMALKGRSDG